MVVCAAGYVAYDGFTRPGYPTDRKPETLSQSAGDVLRQISEDHWPAIAAEREIKTAFVPEVEKSRKATGAKIMQSVQCGKVPVNRQRCAGIRS